MPRYMVESPHTPEECMRAMDETLAEGSNVLEKFDFGCQVGEHTAWATVDVPNESAARNMVPGFLRSKAHVVQVKKYTPEEIKAAHRK